MPLVASASSGLPVSFRVLSGPAYLDAGAVIATNTGTVTVVAEQLGDTQHSPVSLTRSFNPLALTIESAGRFNTGGGAWDVQVVGNLAYVAAGFAGPRVLDVSDPSAIKQLGGYLSWDPNAYAWGVQVVDDLAYLANGSAGLRILDVSDPANLGLVGDFVTRGSVNNLRVAGSVAYIVGFDAGIWTLEVSDPAAIQRLGFLGVFGDPGSAVSVAGNRAYAAMTRAGLLVLDVSDPATLKLLGKFATGDWALDVQVVGSVAYVAAGNAGLEVLDVSDPLAIKRLGTFKTSGPAWAVEVVGNTAYVAEYEAGIQVLDVSNPADIRLLNSFDTSGEARGVQVVGDLAYISDGNAGLRVLRMVFGIGQTLTCALPEAASMADSPIAVEANSSLGLPVKCSVVSGPATIDGNQLNLMGPGTVVVRLEQAGDDQVLPMTLEKTLAVAPIPARLTLIRGEALGTGRLRFEVAGESGAKVVVQFSEDLEAWNPVSTNTLPATLDFPRNTGATSGFYRVLAAP